MSEVVLRVVPNARQTRCEGLMDDGCTLRLRLAAPPVDGKANAALLDWIAAQLGVRRSAVRLVAGEHSRTKRVAVDGFTREEILGRLAEPQTH